MTQNISSLVYEIFDPGMVGTGTPYSRAQNTMAHCGLAALFASGAINFGASPLQAIIFVVALGAIWEIRGILLSQKHRKNISAKATVDLFAYVLCGTSIVAQNPIHAIIAIKLCFALCLFLAIAGKRAASRPA